MGRRRKDQRLHICGRCRKSQSFGLEVPDSFPDPVFNVGTAVETTLNGLYKEIARLLGKTPEPIYHPDRPGELMKYCLDFSKINNVLGWKPEFDLASGLKKKLQTEKLI